MSKLVVHLFKAGVIMLLLLGSAVSAEEPVPDPSWRYDRWLYLPLVANPEVPAVPGWP